MVIFLLQESTYVFLRLLLVQTYKYITTSLTTLGKVLPPSSRRFYLEYALHIHCTFISVIHEWEVPQQV
jgi:hypothetical protein